MTILFGILAYFVVMSGILVFFRFVRSTDESMREITLEAAELRQAHAIPNFHRQSA